MTDQWHFSKRQLVIISIFLVILSIISLAPLIHRRFFSDTLTYDLSKFDIPKDSANVYVKDNFEPRKKYDDFDVDKIKKNKEYSPYPDEGNKKQYTNRTAVKNIEIFDINTASKEQLTKIYGIGETFANRIIKYRNLLGGFYAEHQLKEIYGLPDSTIIEIKKHIKFGTVQKIDLTASYKEIIKHPYIDKTDMKMFMYHQKGWVTLDSVKKVLKNKDKISPYLP